MVRRLTHDWEWASVNEGDGVVPGDGAIANVHGLRVHVRFLRDEHEPGAWRAVATAYDANRAQVSEAELGGIVIPAGESVERRRDELLRVVERGLLVAVVGAASECA